MKCKKDIEKERVITVIMLESGLETLPPRASFPCNALAKIPSYYHYQMKVLLDKTPITGLKQEAVERFKQWADGL
jgi:hypothetical protein